VASIGEYHVVGELTGWILPILHYADECSDMDLGKNTLKLSLAQFNMCSIRTCERVLVYWILIRRAEIHDLEHKIEHLFTSN